MEDTIRNTENILFAGFIAGGQGTESGQRLLARAIYPLTMLLKYKCNTSWEGKFWNKYQCEKAERELKQVMAGFWKYQLACDEGTTWDECQKNLSVLDEVYGIRSSSSPSSQKITKDS